MYIPTDKSIFENDKREREIERKKKETTTINYEIIAKHLTSTTDVHG